MSHMQHGFIIDTSAASGSIAHTAADSPSAMHMQPVTPGHNDSRGPEPLQLVQNVPLYEIADGFAAVGADGNSSDGSAQPATLADRIMCCWNCGSSQHKASECTKTHDRGTFNARRRLFMRFRELKGANTPTPSRYHAPGAMSPTPHAGSNPPRRRRADPDTIQQPPTAPPLHMSLALQELLCAPSRSRPHPERMPRQLLRRQRRLGYPPGYLPPPAQSKQAAEGKKHQELWQGRLAAVGAEAQAALEGWWGRYAGGVVSGPNEYPLRRAAPPPCPRLRWRAHQQQEKVLPAFRSVDEEHERPVFPVQLPAPILSRPGVQLPVCTCGAPIQAHTASQEEMEPGAPLASDSDSDEGEVALSKGGNGGSLRASPPVPGVTHYAGFNIRDSTENLSAADDALGVYQDSTGLGEELPTHSRAAGSAAATNTGTEFTAGGGDAVGGGGAASPRTVPAGAVPAWMGGAGGGIVPPLHPQRVCALHGGRASMLLPAPGTAWGPPAHLLPFDPAPEQEQTGTRIQLPEHLRGPLQPIAAIKPLPAFESTAGGGHGRAGGGESLNAVLQGLDMPQPEQHTGRKGEETPWGQCASVHGISAAFLPLLVGPEAASASTGNGGDDSRSSMSVSSGGGGSCRGSAGGGASIGSGVGSDNTAVEAATQLDGSAGGSSSSDGGGGDGSDAAAGAGGVADLQDAVEDETVDREDRDVIAAAEHAARWV